MPSDRLWTATDEEDPFSSWVGPAGHRSPHRAASSPAGIRSREGRLSGAARSDHAESRLLEALQRGAFSYFLHETNRANGLVRDKTCADWPASIAAVGLALTAYPVGVERGFIPRAEAAERTLTTLRFFWRSKQGPEPDATGYKGFYYHFLDMHTGARAWQCELSTVDSAFLLGGMLVAAAYFDADAPVEREIRNITYQLYARVDWRWAQNGGATVTHGWRPEGGFLPYRWASTYQWKTVYDNQFLYAGPLFTHQLSHVWIDFRGIQDADRRDDRKPPIGTGVASDPRMSAHRRRTAGRRIHRRVVVE